MSPAADLETVRAAYRRLARLYHPDLNPGPDAAVRMRAVNAAYAVLSDPARRAALDARRYLPRSQTLTVSAQPRASSAQPRARRVPVAVAASPPTPLQRRVDRIVAVLGVLLLVAIGFYTVNVIPYAERQLQAENRSRPAVRSTPGPADGQPTAGAYVPERLRSDSGLKAFPGAVLVAPARLEPFASLPITRLDAASLGIARYAVYYGDLTHGGASIAGLIGRASFDAGAPRLADCAPEADYCSGLVPGQSSGPPGLELFRAADLVEDSPAFVTHRVCCNGVFWSLSWYSPRVNISYTLDLSRNIAARYGSQTIDGDVDAARAVAALAGQLVPLP